MAEDESQQPTAVREGSRWLYAPPSEAEVIDWFKRQTLHDGMPHDPYIGGIVTIGAVEKLKVTKLKANGDPMVIETQRSVFVPYMKVDSRIAYFWDYVRALNGGKLDGEYVGVIEPVEVPKVDNPNSGFFNGNLPAGFTVHAVRTGENNVAKYVCATWRAAIYKRADLETEETVEVTGRKWTAHPYEHAEPSTTRRRVARPILEGVGTKQTPMVRQYADDSALMKAETGAIGRALGVAGILVVGTGVASAEDVQEALSGGQGATATPEAPALPTAPPGAATEAAVAGEVDLTPEDEDRELRAQAVKLREELERDHPDKWKLYVEWYQGREFPPLTELKGPALKGAVQKLERDLAAS